MTFSKTWDRLACRLHELMPLFSYPIIKMFEPELPDPVARAAGQHTWESYSGTFQNVLLNQNFFKLLDQVADIPILVIASNQDEYSKDFSIKNFPQRRNLILVKIEGGHNVLLQYPDRISNKILQFLK